LREIRIGGSKVFGAQTKLVLGVKMPDSTDFCIWSGAICSLKPGTFGGAKAMSLYKTESGFISQFRFDYGVMSNDAVYAQIDDYTRRLGKPSSDSTVRADEGGIHKIAWMDSATTFELTYKTSQDGTRASASLMDNSLAQRAH
jgi:hypothetical protein